MDRSTTSPYLQNLDSEHDHQQICHWLAGYAFPWEIDHPIRSYPQGYGLEDIGPAAWLDRFNRR